MTEDIQPLPDMIIKAIRRETGHLIRMAREDLGMSQSDLAAAMNRRQAYISELETGKTEPSLSTLIELGRFLKKPVVYFVPMHLEDESGQPRDMSVLSPDEGELIKLLRGVDRYYDYGMAMHLLRAMVGYAERKQNFFEGEE